MDYSLLAGIDIQNHTITVGIVDYMHRYSVFVVFLFVLAATLDLTLNLFLSDVFFLMASCKKLRFVETT